MSVAEGGEVCLRVEVGSQEVVAREFTGVGEVVFVVGVGVVVVDDGGGGLGCAGLGAELEGRHLEICLIVGLRNMSSQPRLR